MFFYNLFCYVDLKKKKKYKLIFASLENVYVHKYINKNLKRKFVKTKMFIANHINKIILQSVWNSTLVVVVRCAQ